jgi:predicted dehydrogenase
MHGERVRTGVIGVGSLGQHHARLLRDLPGSELIGVYDRSAERLAAIGGQLGVPTSTELAALLERIDACVIAVPTEAHEPIALAAIDAGVHVLIEKPIAPTLESADRILTAAEAAGIIVQIGHVERFNSALRACAEVLEAPLFVESHRLAPFAPRGTDVAVVLDLMIHDVDLVLSLMKRPVATIAAVGVPVLTHSPDIANARLEFEGGGVANLTASRVSLERMRKIRFFQQSGYISLDLAAGRGEFLRLRPGSALALGGAGGVGRIEDIIERVPLGGDGIEPLRVELEHFLAAVAGDGAVVVSGEDGRAALAVALEIVDRIEHHVAHRNPARS